ncbi:major facilitator superfamily domain-containing protein [Leptodontidium sp. MPI-SDFR-AT-0119]|nr:major facilitator superfamily domain-containing protein [Leptodontidium sp. MPI-SDFR-AT-0119]
MPSETENAGLMRQGRGQQLAILVSLILSQAVQIIPFGVGIAGGLSIAKSLGSDAGGAAWIVASYSMTQGTFVLIGGRLGDVYGHRLVYLAGSVWWTLWMLVSAWAPNVIALCVFRALCGVGGGVMVPNIVALLAITFPPGKIRNIAFGLFGAMGPIGAAGGSVFAGLFVQLTPWKYVFIFMAVLGSLIYGTAFLVVPKAPRIPIKEARVDWLGAYLGVAGLILFNFVWNQSALVGWEPAYEYILLIVSMLHFGAFYWRIKTAPEPILPLDIWTAPSFAALILSALFNFMAFGVALWFMNIWILDVRKTSILTASAYIQPFTVCATLAAFLAAYLVRKVDAQHLLAAGAGLMMASNAILSRMPAQQTYWAGIFPAVVLAAFSPDFVFTASQTIASNSVKRSQQGIAGSLIGTLLNYGISAGVGFGGTVERYLNKSKTSDNLAGIRGALYLGIGFGAMGLILAELFVRIEKDGSDLGPEDGIEVPDSSV